MVTENARQGTTDKAEAGSGPGSGPYHATGESLARALGVSPSWVARYRRQPWFPGAGSRGYDELAVRDAAARNVRGWIDRARPALETEDLDAIASLACSPDPVDRRVAAQLMVTLRLVARSDSEQLRRFMEPDASGQSEECRLAIEVEAWLASDAFLELSHEQRVLAVKLWRSDEAPLFGGWGPRPRPDLWNAVEPGTSRRRAPAPRAGKTK